MVANSKAHVQKETTETIWQWFSKSKFLQPIEEENNNAKVVIWWPEYMGKVAYKTPL